MSLDADTIVKAVLGAMSAAGIGTSVYQHSNAMDYAAQIDHWRQEVSDVRARYEAQAVRDSDTCQRMVELARNR